MTDKHNIVPVADTVPTRMVLHPLVEKMLTTNPTPEALEKILGMQRDWENNEARRAFDAALVELKRALPAYLQHDATVDFTNKEGRRTHYTHSSLAGAMETVTPHLVEHGFSLRWKPGTTDKGMVKVTAILTHRLGHSEEATLEAQPDGSGGKNSVQAIASTITLLERYSGLAILGMSSRDQKEPIGESGQPNVEAVNTTRNMKAMASVAKAGKTKAEAETVAGKPMAQWTSTELDKLRAWMEPTKSTDPIVGKDEINTLKSLMAAYKLSPEDFGSVIEHEIGRKPTGAADLKRSEFAKVVQAFDEVEADALTISGGKIQRPPV